MNPDLPVNVQLTVESICELGCTRVNEIIDALESGTQIEETINLDKTAQQRVLHELKQIMAVYENDRP